MAENWQQMAMAAATEREGLVAENARLRAALERLLASACPPDVSAGALCHHEYTASCDEANDVLAAGRPAKEGGA